MPSLTLWLKLLHVVIAFWFIAGLIGRSVVIRQAAGAPRWQPWAS